ncbi:hypothetical protein LCGC14_1102800 [marine sediment metagenome]|uniref:Uncharacterized protein n=1 Tax=marine sediment metagenome TaxID=412755 RepID=A0A0F9M908_9ZZZZ
MGYKIMCKSGYVLTDEAGQIRTDAVGRYYRRQPGPDWRILGLTTRHHAHQIITLAEAADGAWIGQGWIHDMDHGTHRTWSLPRGRRAVRVERT